jgi:manganese/zinc/iron transport system substrate-binding protein
MKIYIVLTIILSFTLMNCSKKNNEQKSKGLNIVCTTGIIADLVKNIGGESIDVHGLMGPGVDPHLYKPSQGDIRKLSKADIIFYNGLHLEGKMVGIFEKMARSRPVIPVSRNISKELLVKPIDYEGAYDPHIWFDVSLWMQTIDVVLEELVRGDSSQITNFGKNAVNYKQQLETLHKWILDKVNSVPKEQRVLITAHDAFTYFGLAYDIEVHGLQGISTVAEYGVKDVSRLVDFISERKIKAIFVESSVPQRSINAVKEGCKSKGYDVRIGGTLYSDALGGPGSGAETYINMVELNVMTIVEALK